MRGQSDISSELLRSSDRERCRRACCCVRGLCGARERRFLRPSLTTVAVAVIVRIDRRSLLRALVIFGAASSNLAYEQRLPTGVIKCSHGGFAPQRDGHTVLSR
jgi:hypothetical protein